jgi:hypothetical protein
MNRADAGLALAEVRSAAVLLLPVGDQTSFSILWTVDAPTRGRA